MIVIAQIVWFAISRAAAYFTLFGVWLFSGLFCLVGGPGRPTPTDSWAIAWILGTIALVPIIIIFTKWNLAILIRLSACAYNEAEDFVRTELDKA